MKTIARILELAYKSLSLEDRAELRRLALKVLIALVTAAGAGGIFLAVVVDKSGVDSKVGDAAKPVAVALSVVHEQCPSGWKDVSATDIHLRVLSCQKGDWLVILKPDGSFDHGVKTGQDARFVFVEREVPGWH